MITVRVPATTANLGPGFDRLGLALNRHFQIKAQAASTWQVQTHGYGSDMLPQDATNLIVRSYMKTCEQRGWPIKPQTIQAENPIPVNAGLGSSATAIVAGIVLAFLSNNQEPDRQQIFQLAAQIEGHPDNVAPAVFGGLCDCHKHDDQFVCQQQPLAKNIRLLVAEVDDRAETSAMRHALPKPIPAATWAQADSMVTTLLKGLRLADTQLLKISEQDTLHQPYRFPLLKRSQQVFQLFCSSPLLSGAFLSGSGPTVAAWLVDQQAVPEPLQTQLSQLGFSVRSSVMLVDRNGFQTS